MMWLCFSWYALHFLLSHILKYICPKPGKHTFNPNTLPPYPLKYHKNVWPSTSNCIKCWGCSRSLRLCLGPWEGWHVEGKILGGECKCSFIQRFDHSPLEIGKCTPWSSACSGWKWWCYISSAPHIGWAADSARPEGGSWQHHQVPSQPGIAYVLWRESRIWPGYIIYAAANHRSLVGTARYVPITHIPMLPCLLFYLQFF